MKVPPKDAYSARDNSASLVTTSETNQIQRTVERRMRGDAEKKKGGTAKNIPRGKSYEAVVS